MRLYLLVISALRRLELGRSSRLVCVQKTKTAQLAHLGTKIYIFVWWLIILLLNFKNNLNLNNKQRVLPEYLTVKHIAKDYQGCRPMGLLTLCQGDFIFTGPLWEAICYFLIRMTLLRPWQRSWPSPKCISLRNSHT